jgi:hypothetical protein
MNKATKAKLSEVTAYVKKHSSKPLFAQSLPTEALPAETVTKIKANPFIMRQQVPKSVTKASFAEFIWEANDLFANDNISVHVGMWVTEDAINFRVTVQPL